MILVFFFCMKIKVKKLSPDANLPCYAHPGDAGLDFFSIEDYDLKPMERHLFSTGISLELPEGFVALVWDKSGLGAVHGIKVLGGVIDAHYRGEYKIGLLNTSDKSFHFKKGDKLAQVLIQPVVSAELEEVDKLSDSVRGEKGFGSSGK